MGQVIPRFPHCDPCVLHAPGECQFCDAYPEWQELRFVWSINYTGQHLPGKMTCPSEQSRDVDTINKWPGNRPWPKAPR